MVGDFPLWKKLDELQDVNRSARDLHDEDGQVAIVVD